MGHYPQLLEKIKEIYHLRNAMALLGWDQETYMPPMGAPAREAQVSVLATITHEKTCSPQLGEWLLECMADKSLNEDQHVIVREFKRDRDRDVKIPADLVKRLSEAVSKGFNAWVGAKKSSDFTQFSPYLEELVRLSKEKAAALGYPSGGTPYDALLDLHEPGLTVKEAAPVIYAARDITVRALNAIKGSSVKPDSSILSRHYPKEAQAKLSQFVLEKLPFNLDAGRLDVSEHPFSTNFSIGDVRLTTHYDEHYLPAALFGTIHECGHGLYEQGLPLEYEYTPLGESLSLGIHESQSRFWENMIGRSLPFIQLLFPKLIELFPGAMTGVTLESLYAAVNDVKPSLVRIEADEVTYNLHIAIRFEIEQLLFNNSIRVEDLPEAWNQKMMDYLGIKPANDRDGVLQDVHWSHGSFGYFPTYLLGNLYGAQWLHRINQDIKGMDQLVAKGDFTAILEWLRANIHRHGRRYQAPELVQRATGEPLNPKYFEEYLKQRFGGLYRVTW